MDKLTEVLLEALKQALAEPGEQRLFRSGKLPGLFSSRSGTALPLASRCRIIARSGTMPDPPATSSSGPPSDSSQMK